MNLHKPSFGRQHMEAMPPWASCWCIANTNQAKTLLIIRGLFSLVFLVFLPCSFLGKNLWYPELSF